MDSKSTWIINLALVDFGRMTSRQELPDEAFFTYDELRRTCGGTQRKDIIALSYMWLTKEHPDPFAETLRELAKQFWLMLRCALLGTGIGVFLAGEIWIPVLYR